MSVCPAQGSPEQGMPLQMWSDQCWARSLLIYWQCFLAQPRMVVTICHKGSLLLTFSCLLPQSSHLQSSSHLLVASMSWCLGLFPHLLGHSLWPSCDFCLCLPSSSWAASEGQHTLTINPESLWVWCTHCQISAAIFCFKRKTCPGDVQIHLMPAVSHNQGPEPTFV